MTNSEEKNGILKKLQEKGKGRFVLAEFIFDDSFINSYNEYRSELETDGYLKVIDEIDTLNTQNSASLLLTDAGNDFINEGGYK